MRTAIYLLSDANYVQLARAQAEFLSSQWQTDVHLFIEDDNVSQAPVSAHKNVFIHLNALRVSLPENAPDSTKWPKVVFFRNYAPKFLSQYDRLLYLDIDILSLKAAPELWTIPLRHGIGAAADTATLFRGPLDTGLNRTDWLERIGVQSGTYINSGVLLIEPQKWDVSLLDEKLATYYDGRDVKAIKSQDFLNHVFDGRWTELSPRWNFQPPFFELGLEDAIDPVFLHFCNRVKPWFFPGKPGASHQRVEHEEAFRSIFEQADVDPNSLSRMSEFHRISQLRKSMRRTLTQMGLRSSKEKREHKKWRTRRETMLNYLKTEIDTQAFVDKRDHIPSTFDTEPKTTFDGQTIRAAKI